MNEKAAKVTHLGRLSLRTQLRITNSATSALKEAFDPKGQYVDFSPFTHILLPYKLTKNAEDRLVPGTKMDMELAQRLGRQLLELSKAVGFAACYTETLATRSEKFQQSISILFRILTSAFDIFAMALIHHDKFACCCSMKMMMVRKMYVISV